MKHQTLLIRMTKWMQPWLRLPARVNLLKVTTLKQDHVRFAMLKLQRV